MMHRYFLAQDGLPIEKENHAIYLLRELVRVCRDIYALEWLVEQGIDHHYAVAFRPYTQTRHVARLYLHINTDEGAVAFRMRFGINPIPPGATMDDEPIIEDEEMER